MKMVSNDELKEINNKNRTFYYFDDIIKTEDFDFDNILLDEKSYENILVYDISYKILIGEKSLHISFDKTDGSIRVYYGTRYLVLSGPEKYGAIYDRSRYLLGQIRGITYVISHNYARIKIDSYDPLPLEKTLSLHNVIILIKSIFYKDQNRYYYNMLLEKCLHK